MYIGIYGKNCHVVDVVDVDGLLEYVIGYRSKFTIIPEPSQILDIVLENGYVTIIRKLSGDSAKVKTIIGKLVRNKNRNPFDNNELEIIQKDIDATFSRIVDCYKIYEFSSL